MQHRVKLVCLLRKDINRQYDLNFVRNVAKTKIHRSASPDFLLLNSVDVKPHYQIAVKIFTPVLSHVDRNSLRPQVTGPTLHRPGGEALLS